MKNYYSLSVSRTVNQLIMRVHKPKVVEYKLVHLYSYTQGSTLTYYYINKFNKDQFERQTRAAIVTP